MIGRTPKRKPASGLPPAEEPGSRSGEGSDSAFHELEKDQHRKERPPGSKGAIPVPGSPPADPLKPGR